MTIEFKKDTHPSYGIMQLIAYNQPTAVPLFGERTKRKKVFMLKISQASVYSDRGDITEINPAYITVEFSQQQLFQLLSSGSTAVTVKDHQTNQQIPSPPDVPSVQEQITREITQHIEGIKERLSNVAYSLKTDSALSKRKKEDYSKTLQLSADYLDSTLGYIIENAVNLLEQEQLEQWMDKLPTLKEDVSCKA